MGGPVNANHNPGVNQKPAAIIPPAANRATTPVEKDKINRGLLSKEPAELKPVDVSNAQWDTDPPEKLRRQDNLAANARNAHCENLQGVETRVVKATANCPGGLESNPEHKQTNDVILFVHGGGFISGSAVTHKPITAYMAQMSGAKVFSMNYPLAPGATHPTQRDEIIKAINAKIAELPPGANLIIAGDSAGAGLISMALAEMNRVDASQGKTRDTNLDHISSFISLYGAFGGKEGGSITADGRRENALNTDCLNRYYNSLGAGRDINNPESTAKKLPPNLPITLVIADNDPLRDDSNRVEATLNARNQAVNTIHVPNANHSFMKDIAYYQAQGALPDEQAGGGIAHGVMQEVLNNTTFTPLPAMEQN